MIQALRLSQSVRRLAAGPPSRAAARKTAETGGHCFSRTTSRSILSSRLHIGLVLLLISSAVILATTRVDAQAAGLTSGQWAHYTVAGDLSEGVVASNFTVQSFQSNILTVIMTDTYSGGSEQDTLLSLNLLTGQGNTFPGLYYAILPRKSLGNPVYQDAEFSITVRLTGTFAQASRQVNYAAAANSTDKIEYFWDVETGIFVEIRHIDISSSKVLLSTKIAETIIWEPSQDSQSDNTGQNDNTGLYTAGVTLASGFLLAAVLLGRYARRKPRK